MSQRSNKVTNPPEYLKYGLEYADDYENLITDHDSPFRGKLLIDVFLYSMALGFAKGKREPLKKYRQTLPWDVSSMKANLWLVYSIAIFEKQNLEVLLDLKEVAKIAEEYAHYGFPYLKELIYPSLPEQTSPLVRYSTPIVRLESQVRHFLQDIEMNNLYDYNKLNKEYNKETFDVERSAEIINKIEIGLRELILSKLTNVSNDWMEDRIPTHIKMVQRWKENKEKNTNAEKLFGKNSEELPLIYHSGFWDLYEIIRLSKNWDEIFKDIFVREDQFKVEMEQLKDLRNVDFHSKPKNDNAFITLQYLGSKYINTINEHLSSSN